MSDDVRKSRRDAQQISKESVQESGQESQSRARSEMLLATREKKKAKRKPLTECERAVRRRTEMNGERKLALKALRRSVH